MSDLPPSVILYLGAFLAAFAARGARRWISIGFPALAFVAVAGLPEGESLKVSLLAGFGELTLLRVDALAKAFGYIFTLNAVAAFWFGVRLEERAQSVASLVYIGSALGVIFAGDLLSLYVHWELMAVSSAFVVLARRTGRSSAAAFRYVMVHLVGGLLLLAGMVLVYVETGSLAFDAFSDPSAGTWLILLGFLVNAAAVPLGAWLPDAYPEASVVGGLILSAYTTKTAVYTLLRGFPEWEILIWVGCAMSVYGIIYALLENDMRRILAYSIVNQVGFMVCAAGIGTTLAINGAVAHAFCHIIYKSLLWMAAGAVLYRVGKSKCTDLGGLYKTMPWTMILGTVGALAISSVPLTSGFTSKTLILSAAEAEHLFWPWLVLEAASAGVFLHAGIKFPYFVFFSKDSGLRPKEAPESMLGAMGVMAFLCIFLGIFPGRLYSILPYEVDYNAYTSAHVMTQMQLLLFSAMVFFLLLPLLRRTSTISLDSDWFYRVGGPAFYRATDRFWNGLNARVHRWVVSGVTRGVSHFFKAAPSRILVGILSPYWKLQGYGPEETIEKRQEIYEQARLGAFPIGITACLAVVLLALLFFL